MTSIRTLRRVLVLSASVAAALAGITLGAPAQAAAPAATVRPATIYPWTVEDSPGSWFKSPSTRDPGTALGNGTAVSLTCYFIGAPSGPYANTLWYKATTASGASGFINDHNLNTPGTATNPEPQTDSCPMFPDYGTIPVSGPAWTAVNSPGQFDNSQNSANYSGMGVADGDTIKLDCYYYGNPEGTYGDPLWYYAEDLSRLVYIHGWINDHFLNTPGTAANPQPQVGHC